MIEDVAEPDVAGRARRIERVMVLSGTDRADREVLRRPARHRLIQALKLEGLSALDARQLL